MKDEKCNVHHAMRGKHGGKIFTKCLLPNGHKGDCKIECEEKMFLVSQKGFYDHPPIEVQNAI